MPEGLKTPGFWAHKFLKSTMADQAIEFHGILFFCTVRTEIPHPHPVEFHPSAVEGKEQSESIWL